MTLFVKNPEKPGFSATFQSAQTWHAVEHDAEGDILVHFDSPALAEFAVGLVQAVIGNRDGVPQVALAKNGGPNVPEKFRAFTIVMFPARFASIC